MRDKSIMGEESAGSRRQASAPVSITISAVQLFYFVDGNQCQVGQIRLDLHWHRNRIVPYIHFLKKSRNDQETRFGHCIVMTTVMS